MTAPTQAAESQARPSPLPAQTRIDHTTRLLRGVGAALLLASASSFLVQRWGAGNDMMRFGFLLAHSFVLLGAALFCGGRLGETRSARLFLWTGLAMIPVHFGVLGGLVYSQFGLDRVPELLPSYAVWRAPSPGWALLGVLGTLLTVAPAALVSTRVLTPKRARLLTFVFIAACSLLLVPIRSADWVGALACIGALGLLFVEKKLLAGDFRMRTGEGRLVRGLLWVPVAMLVGRTLIFYPSSLTFVGLLLLATATCGWVLCRGASGHRVARQMGEWLSTIVGCAGVLITIEELGLFDHAGLLSLLAVPATFLAAAKLTRFEGRGFEHATMLSALTAAGASLAWGSSVLDGAAAIVVSTLCVGSAILMGRPLAALPGAVLGVAGVAVVFERAVGFEHLANWGTLSVLGVLIVGAAALLERRREHLVRWLEDRSRVERPESVPHRPDCAEHPDIGEAQASQRRLLQRAARSCGAL